MKSWKLKINRCILLFQKLLLLEKQLIQSNTFWKWITMCIYLKPLITHVLNDNNESNKLVLKFSILEERKTIPSLSLSLTASWCTPWQRLPYTPSCRPAPTLQHKTTSLTVLIATLNRIRERTLAIPGFDSFQDAVNCN